MIQNLQERRTQQLILNFFKRLCLSEVSVVNLDLKLIKKPASGSEGFLNDSKSARTKDAAAHTQ